MFNLRGYIIYGYGNYRLASGMVLCFHSSSMDLDKKIHYNKKDFLILSYFPWWDLPIQNLV